MLQLFREVEIKCSELEQLRIMSLASEVMYRQKGELHTADALKKLELHLTQAIQILSTPV